MAARLSWEDVDLTTKCPICLETLTDPKTLPCLHSFCLMCLDNSASIGRRQHHDKIKCAICKTSVPIPEENTFRDFPTSFHLDRFKEILTVLNGDQATKTCMNCNEGKMVISYCFVCQDYLCSPCERAHRRLRVTRDHRNILFEKEHLLDRLQGPVMCEQEGHEGKDLLHYCDECKEYICDICQDDSHWRHDVVDIHQAARKGKKRLDKILKKAEDEISATEGEIKKNEDIFKSRKKKLRAARKNVKAVVEKLIKNLKQHEKAVLTRIKQISRYQQKRHAKTRRKLQLFVTQLISPVEHGKCVLKRNIDMEIVKDQKSITSRCKDLLNSKKPETLFLPFVNYAVDEELCHSVNCGPGQLIVSETDPSRSVASGNGLTEAVVGRKTMILVCTRDSKGKQCYHENDHVKIKISSPLGEELETEFVDENNGRYKVTFTPKLAGQHDVMVNVNGQPLADSPWIVQVTPHQYQRKFDLGSKIQEERGLSSPRDVAISQVNGNIAVLDFCRIQLYDANGKYLSQFGSCSSSLSKNLKLPQSVAFSISGDVVVIDRMKVTLCTERGGFVRYFLRHTKDPHSVSVARDGRVIVCDNGDALVKVLSPNGEALLQSFGDPYEYGSPSFAIHHQDKFFVSFGEKHCVSVFNVSGTFLYDIGAQGDTDEKLNAPLGLAIDKFNNLIVCDSNVGRLQVYTLEGRYVTTITGFGSPQFVAVSEDGHMYVADEGKRCVHVLH